MVKTEVVKSGFNRRKCGSQPLRRQTERRCRDPQATDAKPGDRISVTFTKDQYKNGSGFKALRLSNNIRNHGGSYDLIS